MRFLDLDVIHRCVFSDFVVLAVLDLVSLHTRRELLEIFYA